jgi:tRNA-specific adenosine deaminase 3
MCSMALLHSRVKDVFYLYPMSKTGGCGGSTCVPGLKGVNHRFGIWKWKAPGTLGTPLQVEDTLDA